MTLLRAAVIGAGFVGPHHVDAVRRGGYGEVVALGGADRPQLEAVARSLGIERATLDIGSLLSDPGIDIVHICTPNATHVALATAALEAGKHIVVEKPLALDERSAWRLVELAGRNRRHAMVSFTYRGYPMIRHARSLVDDGALGRIRLAHGQYLQDWLARASDYNWRLEPAAGGASRAVADIGSHWFDTIEYVSGLRVEAVFADLATFIPFRARPSSDTIAFGTAMGATQQVAVASEDAATILVRFEGGARGACVVSQVSPGHKNDFSIELAGTERSLAWRQETPEGLWLGAIEGTQSLVRVPVAVDAGVPQLPSGHPEGWGEALRDLLRSFYAAIFANAIPPEAGAPAPYPTLIDGARAVAFVEAALASARESRWVSLSAPGDVYNHVVTAAEQIAEPGSTERDVLR